MRIACLTCIWRGRTPHVRLHGAWTTATRSRAALLRNGGIMIMSLRHGPIPPGRRMFEVSAEETMALAQRPGLSCTL